MELRRETPLASPRQNADLLVLTLRAKLARSGASDYSQEVVPMPHCPTAKLGMVLLVALGLLTACASPPPGARSTASQAEPTHSAPKRVVAAIMAEPAALHRALDRKSVV